MTATVHDTAVVGSRARIGENVEIGPYCVIGDDVSIGANCRLDSHVVLSGHTEIGPGCRFWPFSSIGGDPQDLKFKGESTRLVIGKNNRFRESNTIHIGTAGGGGVTRIGDDNFFMATVHVGHDCQIGNGVIMANGATLAGHVTVMDGATIGAFSGVHQFCRVGRRAYIGGFSVVTQDALPYVLSVGNRAEGHGINVIGLQRLGIPESSLRALRGAYRMIFRSKTSRTEALEHAAAEWGDIPEVAEMITFMRESTRGVVG
ncbi:MAG: acyl-ACP--UDP-N-acetylglucosamine O-acyltransferase [Acidobacteriota bacterium]